LNFTLARDVLELLKIPFESSRTSLGLKVKFRNILHLRLTGWISAGVDAFKIEGRNLPPGKLGPLVSRIRGKLEAAIALSR
jgi:hypothetical protein